jgi:hypothetical protein
LGKASYDVPCEENGLFPVVRKPARHGRSLFDEGSEYFFLLQKLSLCPVNQGPKARQTGWDGTFVPREHSSRKVLD